jgi:CDP-6-deoxy-D-xylo-4-hexulose-3-dehydrase
MKNNLYKMKFNLSDDMLSDADIEEVVELLHSREKLTMSTRVSKFEKEFADYLGVPYAVMVNSGSSANLLAFAGCVNPDAVKGFILGGEVLVPCVCWSTSLWPILQNGLVPVMVDVNPGTFQMDLEDMRRKKTVNTVGVLLVHVIGNCPDMDEVVGWAQENDLVLLEDACEALGTRYKGRQLGTFGRFGTYSFYYSHHITTIEGGMVVCRTQEDADLLRCLRAHGWARDMSTFDELVLANPNIDSRFLFVNVGYNLRSTEINATLGSAQMKRLEEFNTNRKGNYESVRASVLGDARSVGRLRVLECDPDVDVAWFAIPLEVTGINTGMYKDYLTQNGVENRPIISGNFARQPALLKCGFDLEALDFPGAEQVHSNCFYIGTSCLHKYTREEVQELTDILLGF